tara:strand:- start:1 stop:225 length:225 start_codon:yes stop_codon:yes gene_type:complete
VCKKYFIFSFIVLFIFVLDQYTKNTVYTQLELGETIVVFRDYINITYVKNYGAAFGILSCRNFEKRLQDLDLSV